MNENWISVIDVATQHGKRKSTIFKVLKRLGIEARKLRNATGKNQMASYISRDDFQRVSVALISMTRRTDAEEEEEANGFVTAEEGFFYLVQLEPEFDPSRFKVGFAASMPERLRALRCSAPFASVVKMWPCRRLWEKTVIDCVSFGCERLHTEVFRAALLEEVVAKCERFFAVMPPVQSSESNPPQLQTDDANCGEPATMSLPPEPAAP
jgi:hypothetical protein